MIAGGADIGLRRISLAMTDGETFVVESRSLPGKSEVEMEAETFVNLLRAAHDLGVKLRHEFGSPGVIAVEKPAGGGNNSKGFSVSAEMHYSYALVAAGLESVGWESCKVSYLLPNQWKKHALGDGFGLADKPLVMEWAKRFGYSGVSQDEADALGLAVATHRLMRPEPEPEQLAMLE